MMSKMKMALINSFDFLRNGAPPPPPSTSEALLLPIWKEWLLSRIDDPASKVLAIRIPPNVEDTIQKVKELYGLRSKREAVMMAVLVGGLALVEDAQRTLNQAKSETVSG